jgi:hypothetical protein
MSVGIGSKSILAYAIESTYGTFPGGTPAGTQLGIISENIQSSRSSFASSEINPTRQMTSIRSGNVAAAGEINMEFSPNVLGMLLKHLLMPDSYTATTVTPTALTNSLAVTRGSFYTSPANSSAVYLCTRSGTASASASTSGGPVTVDYSEELNGTAYFQYFGAAGSIVYKHTLTAGKTKPTGGFALERQVFLDSGIQYFRYTGGRINTWSLSVPQEGIVRSNFGFIFLDLDSQSGSSLLGANVAATDEPFAGAECVVQVKPQGGSYADDFSLSDFNLNVTNGFDDRVYSVGQRRRRDLPEGMRVITGSFNAYFENVTKFGYFTGETALALLATFNHAGCYATVEVKKCRLTGGSPAPVVSGNGVLTASFNFEAMTDGTNDIVVTLYNTTTTY